MSLLTALIGPRSTPERRTVPLSTVTGWDEEEGWLTGGTGSRAASGVRVTARTALGFSPWYRGINLVSGTVGKLPLVVSRMDGKNKSPDIRHRAHRLLRRKVSGDNQSFNLLPFQWKRLLTSHGMTKGNGYSYIDRDISMAPLSMIPLDPDETYAVRVNGRLRYVTHVGTDQIHLRPDEVLHIKGLGFDGLSGYNVLHIARETLGLGIAARQYGSIYFANDATPRMVVEHPGNLSSVAQTRLKTSWANAYQGLSNAHKFALLEEGMKAHPLSFNAQDSQLIPTLKMSIIEIANILGVQPHKLGDTTRTSHASLEQENMSFLDDSIEPWLVAWEEECCDKLLTEEEKRTESHEIEFDRKALLRTDTLTRRQANNIAVQGGWMNPDQAAADEGWDPLPDGKGEAYYRPMNMNSTVNDTPGIPKGDLAGLAALAEMVVAGAVPADAAKVMVKQAFPLIPDADVTAFIAALDAAPPPPVAVTVKPAATKQLAAPDPGPARAALDSQRQRMCKRIGRCARRAAKKPATFLAWLKDMPDEHVGVVTDALAPALWALSAVDGRSRGAGDEARALLSRLRAALIGAAVETAATPDRLAVRVDEVMVQLEEHPS